MTSLLAAEGGGRGSAAAGAAPLADGDLLGKMAQRLKVVEGKYARAKEEVRSKRIELCNFLCGEVKHEYFDLVH